MSIPMANRRILIIDDNPAIHEDFRKVLRPQSVAAEALDDLEGSIFGAPSEVATTDIIHYKIDSALQGEEGLRKLRLAIEEEHPYAMAFVDMRMPPGWDGVQTIRELWKADRSLQVVICTAYTDYSPEQISEALGASSGLMMLRKPFEQIEIRQVAMTMTDKWNTQRQHDDLEQIVAARTAELRRASLHDLLTGLPNRALFHERLELALKRLAREPEYRFAVLFMDSDRFKIVNDSLGHGAGDQLLLQIADRLQTTLRETDVISLSSDPPLAARLGGDEFAILLDKITSDADAARVAQRLLDALKQRFLISGQEVHSTASIGVTTSSLGYATPEEMIRDADAAMYRAKHAGGSRFVMFDRTMHQNSVARLTLENDLRHAVERGQISLNYQPIVSMRTRQVLGFEALARWNHPERGSVSPAEFIPVAEETGIILPLGVWILEQACRQLKSWQTSDPLLAELTMSVNLSRKQLAAPDLLVQIARILEQTGVDAHYLKLEITESTVMDNAASAINVLKSLQKMDIKLHMDDFGTGHSSLSSLHNFPLDGLKIDRDFVKNVSERTENEAIIRAVVMLAHNLHIPLVAEGIETRDQITLLESMGCDQAQGYYFARPMDTAAATKFIQEQMAVPKAA